MTPASIKFKGKEVQHLFLRALVATMVVLSAIIGMLLTIVVLCVVIPLSIPVHLLLKLCGRRGFVIDHTDGTFSYHINFDGFRARKGNCAR